jgi:hypothetical protein
VRPDVQDAVAKLCCSWWTYEGENREFLVSQALPYLLVSATAAQLLHFIYGFTFHLHKRRGQYGALATPLSLTHILHTAASLRLRFCLAAAARHQHWQGVPSDGLSCDA